MVFVPLTKIQRRRRNHFHYGDMVDGVWERCIKFTKKQWLKVHIREQNNLCGLCGEPMLPPNKTGRGHKSNEATLDHIKPLVMGGIHIFANTRAVHKLCNESRARKEQA